MRRFERGPSLFRGTELPRLLTMIVMLAVVFMLMTRAKDPRAWRWLINQPESSESQPTPDAGQPESVAATHSVEPTGPTDEDPEEADAAREEFQAITDRTLEIQVEEMPAYKRLLKWVENQPIAVLKKRARHDLVFTHLMQSPDKYRGQLVHLDLHLRKILQHPIEENPTGVNGVFEASGFTTESGAWLYWIVFAHAPPGMPTSVLLQEDVSFDGYFLKLQGYYPGGAKPNDPPLVAPLLIGRIVWHPAPGPPRESEAWFWPVVGLGGLMLLLTVARWTSSFLARPRRPTASTAGEASGPIEDWLTQAERSHRPLGDDEARRPADTIYDGDNPRPPQSDEGFDQTEPLDR